MGLGGGGGILWIIKEIRKRMKNWSGMLARSRYGWVSFIMLRTSSDATKWDVSSFSKEKFIEKCSYKNGGRLFFCHYNLENYWIPYLGLYLIWYCIYLIYSSYTCNYMINDISSISVYIVDVEKWHVNFSTSWTFFSAHRDDRDVLM